MKNNLCKWIRETAKFGIGIGIGIGIAIVIGITWVLWHLLSKCTISADAYLEFIGAIIGIIASVMISVSVSKYQIKREWEFREKEKEDKNNEELLPYFNIKNNGVEFNSIRDKSPIEKAVMTCYDERNEIINASGNETHKKGQSIWKNPHNFGHVFPGCPMEIKVYGADTTLLPPRIDVTAILLNGTFIYFTYGNGVEGAHFQKRKQQKFAAYGFENDEGLKIAEKRRSSLCKNGFFTRYGVSENCDEKNQ